MDDEALLLPEALAALGAGKRLLPSVDALLWPQLVQAKGFSPVWMRWCFSRFCLSTKLFLQSEPVNGFSLV
ncbi:hypothetical protein AV530_010294 [Patagioenas fasciata monilis]|uniref:Uncharacterized protein n=1 Tax=Patagioenas fasciata monilis TaxID=372326 RepID=A0A1V4L1J5_PATFA|nr:hypothetical protein AV530_010294 [Patagioenas fasciata monilis]